MQFEDFVGKTALFYGVDGNAFKLDGQVFEALEDESDGYRSYLDSVELKDPSGLIFFGAALANVTVRSVSETSFEGYEIVDVDDGHVWVRLGTDNNDDYYPYFVFSYNPKELR
jgi:hypothetical protein